MTAHKIPKTLKKGSKLYRVDVLEWEGKTSIELVEFIVVSARSKPSYLKGENTLRFRAVKNDPKYYSKGKLTGKYVPVYDELKFNTLINDNLPYDTSTTARRAFDLAISNSEQYLKSLLSRDPDSDELDEYEVDVKTQRKEISLLKSAKTRYLKKVKK
ncbi:hypothetical protein VpasPP24_38 [Vibrio phage Vpas_PP24]|nr:hypothetical protein VpasPP24_38 [Vibrio phage Vpas_PP24]